MVADGVTRYYSDHCLVCGQDNPVGFRCIFHADGERAWTDAVAPKHFEGFGGVIHGGLISALLDEAMWFGIYTKGHATMTVDLNVRLRRSLAPLTPVRVTAKMTGRKRRFLLAQAQMRDDKGVVATAEGRFLTVPEVEAHLQGSLTEERI